MEANNNIQRVHIVNSSNFKIGSINSNLNQKLKKDNLKENKFLDKEDLKKELSNNNIQLVFISLFEKLGDKDELIIIKSECEDINSKIRQGIISEEKSRQALNKIKYRLLCFINLL